MACVAWRGEWRGAYGGEKPLDYLPDFAFLQKSNIFNITYNLKATSKLRIVYLPRYTL